REIRGGVAQRKRNSRIKRESGIGPVGGSDRGGAQAQVIEQPGAGAQNEIAFCIQTIGNSHAGRNISPLRIPERGSARSGTYGGRVVQVLPGYKNGAAFGRGRWAYVTPQTIRQCQPGGQIPRILRIE